MCRPVAQEEAFNINKNDLSIKILLEITYYYLFNYIIIDTFNRSSYR